jgi:multiple sugar transport system permease protein
MHAIAPAPRRSGRSRGLQTEECAALLFLTPWIVGTLLFLAAPAVASLFLSLTDWNVITPARWVGLDNYREMLTDDRRFWVAIRVTLTYVLLSVPLYLVAGLALSLLLNLKLRGINLFRTLLFLPSIIPGVATAVLWLSLLNPDFGVVNSLLRAVGIADPPRWFASPTWAVPSVVIVGLWGIGGGAIVYLAGLQNINPALYEAAAVDGANAWERFRRVTLPMLTPTLFFNLLVGLIGAFQIFDTVLVLGGSRGGARDSLLFYLLYLWNQGFREGRFGYASALAWVLVLVAAIVITVLYRTQDRWVYYEESGER